MKIHCIQHVDFEDLGNILEWINQNNHSLSYTKVFENETFPPTESFDFLIILGGPMGVYNEDKYPWLIEEKDFIKKSIEENKKILGICLGAQLIADVLGAKVYKNEHKEIGWFDIELSPEGEKSAVFKDFPQTFNAFHWHGDTFDVPKDCELLASSEATKNQAFSYENRVFGLQFHLETSIENVRKLIKNCKNELNEQSPFIQKESLILCFESNFNALQKLVFSFLSNF